MASKSSERTLYVDATTQTLMVGLSIDGTFHYRFCQENSSHRYHSAILIPAIQEGLKATQLTPQDLGALAVNTGPGSFTGIRTGLTTIRILGQFLEKPVYAFNTFDLLAAEVPEALTAIYLDALQGNAYKAVLTFDNSGPVYVSPPSLVPLTEPSEAVFSGTTDCVPDRYLISRALTPYFPEKAHVIETHPRFTPGEMQSLITRYGEYFKTHWASIFPLYLQEPRITLKKQRTAKA